MWSQMDADIDEDYLDDPIRIINLDNYDSNFIARDRQKIDAEIVDFGCVLDSEGDNVDQYTRAEKYPSRRPSASPVKLYNNFHSATKPNFCQPVSVKIVDCVKYPSYYTIYKTNYSKRMLNNNDVALHDEDTQEIIVVDLDEDFTADNLKKSKDNKITSHMLSLEVKSPEHVFTDKKNEKNKNSIYKLNNKKQQEYFELQTAIKQRNTIKIDIKKNQGLIGLQITHRKAIDDKIQNKAHTVENNLIKPKEGKKYESKLCESYVEVVDKLLVDVGTSITPILDDKDNRVHLNKTLRDSKDKSKSSQSSINIDKSKTSGISVKCSLKVSSPKFLENIVKLKETKKNVVRKVENQCTSLKKHVSIDFLSKSVEKKTTVKNKSEVSKLISNTFSEYENDTQKNNAKPKNDNKNILQKPMPKSKKCKIIEEIREICAETKENSIASEKIHKKIKTNEITQSHSPILQCTSILDTHIVNKTFPTFKAAQKPKDFDRNRDISNKKVTKVNYSTDIREGSTQDNRRKSKKILLNIPQVNLNSYTKNQTYTDSRKILNEQFVQRDKDDKYPIGIDKNKLDHSVTNNQSAPTVIHVNTILPCTNEPNMKINPKQQEILENSNEATRKRSLLQMFSIHNLNNFGDYISRMKNNDVAVIDKVMNSSVIQSDLSKPHSATVTSETTNNFNQKLPIRTVSERDDGYAKKKMKKPIISICNKKKTNRASAIIVRPTQYQLGDIYTGLPIQSHVSNRFQFPAVPQQMFSNTVEPRRPQLQFHISNKPQLQRTVPTVPQLFSNAAVSIRHQLSLQQTPPLNPCIYHQPHNYVPSPMHNEGDIAQTDLNTYGMHLGIHDINQNPYCFYGYPPPPVPPPPPPPPPPLPPAEVLSQYNPSSRIEENSVIGVNTDGIVKKINITTGPVKKDEDRRDGIVKLGKTSKDVQNFEPITSKMEMLNELSKTILEASPVKNVLKRSFSSDSETHVDENKITHPPRQRAGPLSKKLKLDVPNVSEPITVQDKMKRKHPLANKGYSPPILPIPTYQNLLSQVQDPPKLNKPTLDLITDKDPRFFKESMKTNNAANKYTQRTIHEEVSSKNKEDLKKISLQEYKKRIPRIGNTNITKQDLRTVANNRERQNIDIIRTQYSKNKSKCLPDTGNQYVDKDLGYDSDTTVKL